MSAYQSRDDTYIQRFDCLRSDMCSAHVQHDDVPRACNPVEDEGEFRQHDGVATVMLMLPAQGFA